MRGPWLKHMGHFLGFSNYWVVALCLSVAVCLYALFRRFHVVMYGWLCGIEGFRMLEFYKLGINFFQRPTDEVSAATACLQRSVLRCLP